MVLLDKLIKEVVLPKLKEQLTEEVLPRIIDKIRKEIFKV